MRLKMRSIAGAGLALALALCSAASARDADDAPEGLLPTRLLEPRFAPLLTLITSSPPPPYDEARFSLGAATGQTWKGDSGPGGSVSISAQTLLVRLEGSFGIRDFMSAGFEIPGLAHATSFKRPEDRVSVDIQYGDAVLADSDGSVGGLGDARVFVAAFLHDKTQGVRLARITAVLKAPCGRREGYLGSGAADYGIYADGSFSLAPGLFLPGLAGAVHVGNPRGQSGGRSTHMESAIPFAVGLEGRLGYGWGLNFQVEGVNNVYPATGSRRLDEHAVQATAGLTWRPTPRAGCFLSFSEDLSRGAPDFMVALGIWVVVGEPEQPESGPEPGGR